MGLIMRFLLDFLCLFKFLGHLFLFFFLLFQDPLQAGEFFKFELWFIGVSLQAGFDKLWNFDVCCTFLILLLFVEIALFLFAYGLVGDGLIFWFAHLQVVSLGPIVLYFILGADVHQTVDGFDRQFRFGRNESMFASLLGCC